MCKNNANLYLVCLGGNYNGSHTIAFNTVFEFAASTAPTFTSTDGKTDILGGSGHGDAKLFWFKNYGDKQFGAALIAVETENNYEADFNFKSPIITALPPPAFNPAREDFNVIAFESLKTSFNPSSSEE